MCLSITFKIVRNFVRSSEHTLGAFVVTALQCFTQCMDKFGYYFSNIFEDGVGSRYPPIPISPSFRPKTPSHLFLTLVHPVTPQNFTLVHDYPLPSGPSPHRCSRFREGRFSPLAGNISSSCWSLGMRRDPGKPRRTKKPPSTAHRTPPSSIARSRLFLSLAILHVDLEFSTPHHVHAR